MRYITFISCLLSLLSLGSYAAFGQGCSDAGFCTMNSFKPQETDSQRVFLNQIKVGTFVGTADNAITVFGGYVEYNRQLGEKWGLDVKLTSLAQSGNGLMAFGLSDVFVNANFRPIEKLKLTLGAKIPLSLGDQSRNNLPLPMDYQASLGTVDAIFGIGYEIKKIQIVAAIQQPITQNSNAFLASQYPVDSPLRNFASTRSYQRAGDVLLRVSYPIPITSKFKVTPSILPIYHLANDRYLDEANVEREIIGSRGLTLNGNIYLDYELAPRSAIQLNVGMPFLVREARPDGLTRGFIANLEYRWRF